MTHDDPALDWMPTPDPECVAVGCGGCDEELREYPCNCFTHRGEPNAVAREYGDCFHDGEMTWWQCVFCRRFFDLEDLELMSGDTQGCEPCTGAWYAGLAEHRALLQVPEAPACSRGDEPRTDAPDPVSVA
jgi:hypothetical protein